jgi:hypothetical protein
MQVFYIDSTPRNYYIKIENINVPTDLKGYQRIEAFKSQLRKINKCIYYSGDFDCSKVMTMLYSLRKKDDTRPSFF